MVGIDNRPAIERRDRPENFDAAALLVRKHLRASGHVRAFFGSCRQSESVSAAARRPAPADGFGRGFQNGPQTRVLEIFQAEIQRVHFHGVSQLVHVRFAGKMIGCGRQCAIRALPQRRRVCVVDLALLIGNGVRTPQAGAAGVVIVKFPGGDRAVLRHSAGNVNDSGRAEIGPGKFLLTRPDQFDRLPGGLGQSRGFDGRLPRMLAAVARASVRHDDANRFFRDAKSLGQIAANAERALRTGPHGQFAVLPLRDRCARFQRRVGDVSDGVGGLQFVGCRL